jgi:hypothetical protein
MAHFATGRMRQNDSDETWHMIWHHIPRRPAVSGTKRADPSLTFLSPTIVLEIGAMILDRASGLICAGFFASPHRSAAAPSRRRFTQDAPSRP